MPKIRYMQGIESFVEGSYTTIVSAPFCYDLYTAEFGKLLEKAYKKEQERVRKEHQKDDNISSKT